MRELKAIRGGDIHDLVKFGDGSDIYHEDTLYYLKNDVDAAISELKQKFHDAEMQADLAECAVTEYKIDYDKLNDENAELQKQVHDYAQGLYVIQARADKEARHQKYKRCLAMAKLCGLMSAFHGGEWYARWINRWYERWQELSEKFKEAK